MLVGGVDEILGDDAAGHLEAGDIGIETTAHLGAVEAAGGTQVAACSSVASTTARLRSPSPSIL
jgi:hypothetical protein